jgi:hypothetical protein
MNKKEFIRKYADYIILISIFAFSTVCRYLINFSSNMAPGLDGMYYPLQVRCLLEKGTLGFNDMPFVFWLEALMAKAILLISNYSIDSAVIIGCKLINVIVPSLIVVPVFFFSKSISNNKIKPLYLAIVLALSVLNPTVFVLFSIDFHKNAIGMLFIFIVLYYTWLYLSEKKIKSLVICAFTTILTLLTHFGCFSVLLAFQFILTFVLIVYNFKNLMKWFEKSKWHILLGVSVFIALLLIPVAVKIFDPQRFLHLTGYMFSPLKLFDNSILMLMIKGQSFLHGPRLFFFVILNTFAILSVISFISLRKHLTKAESIFFLTTVLWYVFLSNPFNNIDLFERLLFISLIPLTVVMVFVFTFTKRSVKIPFAVILSLLLLLTILTNGPRKTLVSKQEYPELQKIKNLIPQPSSTIVLAQHGLEWWTGWALHTKTGQICGISPEEYPKYSKVLYIVQKNNKYPEKAPENKTLIHEGQYFALYEIYSKE